MALREILCIKIELENVKASKLPEHIDLLSLQQVIFPERTLTIPYTILHRQKLRWRKRRSW